MNVPSKKFRELKIDDHFIAPDPAAGHCDKNNRPFVMIKRKAGGPNSEAPCTTPSDTFNAARKCDGEPRHVRQDTDVIDVIT